MHTIVPFPSPRVPQRLTLTMCAAAALHLLVILGVDFAPEEPEHRASASLDVLLVRIRAPARPAESSYVAEADREGGRESAGPPPSPPPASAPLPARSPDPLPAPSVGAGTRGAVTRPPPASPDAPRASGPAAPAGTAPRRSGGEAALAREPMPAREFTLAREPMLAQSHLSREHRVEPAPPSPTPEEQRQGPPAEPGAGPGEALAAAEATDGAGAAEGTATTDGTQASAAADPGAVPEGPGTRAPSAADLRAQVIESLSAALDERLQAYAQRPRRKWITAATREHAYAAYMEAWRRKVERVGNLNYPNEARRRGLSGTLSLDVALNADGSVAEVLLRRSSGEEVLDEAALRIVALAAPFARFPRAIREEVDVLHIERTWVFSSRNEFNSR